MDLWLLLGSKPYLINWQKKSKKWLRLEADLKGGAFVALGGGRGCAFVAPLFDIRRAIGMGGGLVHLWYLLGSKSHLIQKS